MKLSILTLTALALTLAACGGGDSGATSTTEATTTTTMPSTTTVPETTTTVPESTTTTGPAGEPIDFGPREGDTVAVIGVAHDDVLNLRSGPGADEEILAEIPNTYEELTALGNTRDLGDSFWIEVEYEGTTGWVHFSFIGFIGVTDDMTAAALEELGEAPVAETMAGIGLAVAETFASAEPASDIVMVVAPTVADLGEVTYDVIGIGDDAVRGYRVHVFGQPADETFEIRSVEVTTLCGRGVTEDGLCT